MTTGKFHTIHLILEYDISGNILSQTIKRLYMRYAFYDVQNYIKYHNNLFVISQILPSEFEMGNRSKQLLTVYSIDDKKSDTVVFSDDPENKV